MKHIKQILPVVFILTLFLLIHSNVYGQTTTSINATIKISICGNSVVEGGEDCDGTNLQGKTCISLGYGSGALNCDISCSFDKSNCIPVTPTPTPTLIPEAKTSTATITSLSMVTEIPTPLPTSGQTALIPSQQSSLPSALKNFDLSGSGRIDKSELHAVIALWVNEWKQFVKAGLQNQNRICDINHNGSCGLEDLSILLFYVGR